MTKNIFLYRWLLLTFLLIIQSGNFIKVIKAVEKFHIKKSLYENPYFLKFSFSKVSNIVKFRPILQTKYIHIYQSIIYSSYNVPAIIPVINPKHVNS